MGYDVTTPKRVRISGTTVARRTKFGHNVHHTQAVVISGSDLEWDPRGTPGKPINGVNSGIRSENQHCSYYNLAQRCEIFAIRFKSSIYPYSDCPPLPVFENGF